MLVFLLLIQTVIQYFTQYTLFTPHPIGRSFPHMLFFFFFFFHIFVTVIILARCIKINLSLQNAVQYQVRALWGYWICRQFIFRKYQCRRMLCGIEIYRHFGWWNGEINVGKKKRLFRDLAMFAQVLQQQSYPCQNGQQ